MKIAEYRKNDVISPAFTEKGSDVRNGLNVQTILGNKSALFFMFLLRSTVLERNGHEQLHGKSLAA